MNFIIKLPSDNSRDKVYFVSVDYKIKFKEKLILLKDIYNEGKEIKKVIYQKDGPIAIINIDKYM